MISLTEFMQFAKTFPFIPFVTEIPTLQLSDLNLVQLKENEPYLLLLESGEHGEEHGRFTYFSKSPFLILQSKQGEIKLTGDSTVVQSILQKGIDVNKTDPKQIIETILETYRSPRIPTLPYFTGGAIGYFSYEWVKRTERIITDHQIPTPFSEFHLGFVKELLVYDHEQKKFLFIDHVQIDPDDSDEMKQEKYEQARIHVNITATQWEQWIRSKGTANEKAAEVVRSDNEQGKIDISREVHLSLKKEEFIEGIQGLKQAIRQGDIFQAVPSIKQSIETKADPAKTYQTLRTLNPSPYMVFLQMEDETLIGASPETLVKIVDEEISTFPIAGTRPRGRNPEEEALLEQDLQNDPKEIAEHVMLIDLARNDLGKVSQPGTVNVVKKMAVEKYSHVMHLVSKVTGRMKPGVTSIDGLKAVFPAGTVSGAPKVRAMELIAELEKEQRGPYAGAVAAIGFNGNLDTCITIRSIFFHQGTAYVQSGAGIVYDSIPEKEYEEVMNKAKAMIQAIYLAENKE